MIKEVPKTENPRDFYKNIGASYPSCSKCITESKSKLQNLDGITLDSLRKNFEELKNSQYSKFNNDKKLLLEEITIIKNKLKSESDQLTISLVTQELDKVTNNINSWNNLIAKSSTNATIDQLNIWINEIEQISLNIKTSVNALRKLKLISDDQFIALK